MTTHPAHGAEVDPSVCYRHPGRQSWVLCQRCGRTICPECQILAPVGVHCPDCVAESSGSVQWRPARNTATVTPIRRRNGVGRRVQTMLRSDSSSPTLTWIILGVCSVLWLAGFFLANAPVLLLAAIPGQEAQIWRFVTAPFVYPSSADLQGLLGFVLNGVFLVLSGPTLERMLGRPRYLLVFLLSTVVSSAFALLAGSANYGLIGPLFGLFGALLVIIWPDPRARQQFLIMIAINLVFNIVVARGQTLPTIIGGLLAGAGLIVLLRRFDDRPPRRSSTPVLIIAGSAVGLVALTILRGLLAA